MTGRDLYAIYEAQVLQLQGLLSDAFLALPEADQQVWDKVAALVEKRIHTLWEPSMPGFDRLPESIQKLVVDGGLGICKNCGRSEADLDLDFSACPGGLEHLYA